MARARNIKPGFYKNEDLAECSERARLLFPGLWMLADREGRLEDRPRRIKGEIFPFDAFDVEPLLEELARWDFIRRYVVNGKRFIQVVRFAEHQSPHGTEKDSDIPDESGFCTVNERGRNGCVTGVSRKVHVSEHFANGALTVNAPLDNALNPESRILNPESGGERQQGASYVEPRSAKPEPEPPDEPDPAPAVRTETPPPGENPREPSPIADPITTRAVGIAVLLRQRGAGVTAGDPRLRGWAERGVTDAALLTALETAERRRCESASLQPVNAGLLDAILADGHGPPARASPAGRAGARERYASQARDAADRLGMDDDGRTHGRNGERDISGECRVVAG